MIAIDSISKNFGNNYALKNTTFSIAHGEIVGLIGPNGSGKTTLLNILIGTIYPTVGKFTIEQHTKMGMAVSRLGFFEDMTVDNNLSMYAKLTGTNESRLIELMNHFHIDYKSKKYGKISAGMKQRVSLITAFLNNYDLILLDEPFNHLDVDSIVALRNLMIDLKRSNTSFLITSHVLSDMEKICDRFLFLKDGFILSNENKDSLLQKFESIENAYFEIFNRREE